MHLWSWAEPWIVSMCKPCSLCLSLLVNCPISSYYCYCYYRYIILLVRVVEIFSYLCHLSEPSVFTKPLLPVLCLNGGKGLRELFKFSAVLLHSFTGKKAKRKLWNPTHSCYFTYLLLFDQTPECIAAECCALLNLPGARRLCLKERFHFLMIIVYGANGLGSSYQSETFHHAYTSIFFFWLGKIKTTYNAQLSHEFHFNPKQ